MGLEFSKNVLKFKPPSYLNYEKTGEYFRRYVDKRTGEITIPAHPKPVVKCSDFWSPKVREKMAAETARINIRFRRPSWDDVSASLIQEGIADASTSAGQDGNGTVKDVENEPVRGEIRENPMRFLLAGRAIFTVENKKTGNRFTYKVIASKDKDGLYFVSVLTGRNNAEDYDYLGTIHGGTAYWPGKKSALPLSAPAQKAFIWAFKRIRDNELPPSVHIYHEGRCGRCGRRLTVPQSIESGFGPECVKFAEAGNSLDWHRQQAGKFAQTLRGEDRQKALEVYANRHGLDAVELAKEN